MPRIPRALWPISFSLALLACGQATDSELLFTEQEKRVLASLSLSKLPAVPPSTGNPVADDPKAVELGRQLFSDTRLSRNGQVACASCHVPEKAFTDGKPLSVGLAQTPRHAPSLWGAAYSKWQFWDGRADSLWAQSLQPLTDPREQGLSYKDIHARIQQWYTQPYTALYGELPSLKQSEPKDHLRVSANVGRALEAYIRTLRPEPGPLDQFIQAQEQHRVLAQSNRWSPEQVRGLRIFLGKGQCVRCHSGPLLTNHSFHNTGIASRMDGQPDTGRLAGIALALKDPFNCAGAFSGVAPNACEHLTHVRTHAPEWRGAYKVPTLRGVSRTAPYMHNGQFQQLEEVVAHYAAAPNRDGEYGHSELIPLPLSEQDKKDLVAFLKLL